MGPYSHSFDQALIVTIRHGGIILYIYIDIDIDIYIDCKKKTVNLF